MLTLVEVSELGRRLFVTDMAQIDGSPYTLNG